MINSSVGMLLALALASGTALAQDIDGPPLGSRLGSRLIPGTVLSPQESARASLAFASCIDDRFPAAVHAFLLSTDPKASQRSFIKGEVDCFSLFNKAPATNGLTDTRVANIPTDVLRGMLAEAEIKRLRSSSPVLQPQVRKPTYSRAYFAVTTRNVFVDEMATCIADVDPAGVSALLESEPYSTPESTAISGLSANFGPCLRAGAKLQANRQSLRAALAEALYQRYYVTALATVASPPVKTN